MKYRYADGIVDSDANFKLIPKGYIIFMKSDSLTGEKRVEYTSPTEGYTSWSYRKQNKIIEGVEHESYFIRTFYTLKDNKVYSKVEYMTVQQSKEILALKYEDRLERIRKRREKIGL